MATSLPIKDRAKKTATTIIDLIQPPEPTPLRVAPGLRNRAEKTATTIMDLTQSSDPTLLGIAPELHNRIYEYALISPSPIDLTDLLKAREPGLLSVCKQVSAEALEMYECNITVSIDNELSHDEAELDDQLDDLDYERAQKIKMFVILPPDHVAHT